MKFRPFAAILALLVALGVATSASADVVPKATTLEKVSSLAQPGIVYMETSYSGIVYDPTIEAFIGGNQSPREFDTLAGSCSGFFVNPDGYFVSAGHCVEYYPEVKQGIIEQAAEWSYQNEAWPDGWTLEDAVDYAARYWKVRSAETPDRNRPDRHVVAAYGVDIGGLPTGKALPARLLGFRAFEEGDVALLKLEAEDVPVLRLAPEADVEVGTAIVSVGYPGSVDLVTDVTFDPSFKEGSVSSMKTIEGGLVEAYEVSAAVSPGMSGGPTVDLQGRVVGVNSFRPAGETQPFNFVSPAAEVAQLMNDKGVENRLGRTNSLYVDALRAYYAGDREEALAKFDQVLGQVREHEFAQKFRAKALRLPKDEGDGFPYAPLVAGIAIAVALAGAAFLLYRRRRGSAGRRAPSGPPPKMPPMTHVTGNGNGTRGASEDAPALMILTGPWAGRRIALGPEIVLGQSTINDDRASRQHATVRPHNGGFELTDLGSPNGTMVNGTRIEGSTELANGDVVTLGRTTIVVDLATAASSQATGVHGVPQQ